MSMETKEARRLYLKNKRTGLWYVSKREDICGNVTIEWTDDPRRATKMSTEKRAAGMAKRLLKCGAPCWQVAMLPGYLESRRER